MLATHLVRASSGVVESEQASSTKPRVTFLESGAPAHDESHLLDSASSSSARVF